MMEWFLVLFLLLPNGQEEQIRASKVSHSQVECNKLKLNKELMETAIQYAAFRKARYQLHCIGVPNSKVET